MQDSWRTIAGVTLAVIWASAALATATPQQECQSSKNKAAGKYAACRENAEAKLASTGDTATYNESISKCETKYQTRWQKAEQKAVDAGSACTTTGDQAAVQQVTDEYSDNVAQHLGGAPLEDCPTDLTTCNSDLGNCTSSYSACSSSLTTCNANYTSCSGSLATCNAGTAALADVLSGKTFSGSAGLGLTGTMPDNGAVNITPGTSPQAIAAGYHNGSGTVTGDTDLVPGNIKNGVNIFEVTGTLQPPPLRTGQATAYGTGTDGDLQAGASRSYTDNGDGTITDNTTGLMWEKKSADGSIHDKDDIYEWGMTSTPYTMNGTIVTTFLAALNSGGGFAGHTDWRMPNLNELLSIANYQNVGPAVDTAFNTGCVANCTITSCSCTAHFYSYWSSTTYQDSPNLAWVVDFNIGSTGAGSKSGLRYVRAVRGGS